MKKDFNDLTDKDVVGTYLNGNFLQDFLFLKL